MYISDIGIRRKTKQKINSIVSSARVSFVNEHVSDSLGFLFAPFISLNQVRTIT